MDYEKQKWRNLYNIIWCVCDLLNSGIKYFYTENKETREACKCEPNNDNEIITLRIAAACANAV